MNNETWAPITSRYEVSSTGRVRSLFGRVRPLKTPRILKPRPLPTGYLRVHLDGKDQYIHRLVATAFIANPDNLPYINHVDGKKANNSYLNLEWCTQKQNLAHAVRAGFMSNQAGRGNHAKARLTDDKVREIRRLYGEGEAATGELAIRYDVSHSLISGIVHGKRWKHVE